MATSIQTHIVLVTLVALILFASPTAAFGAGYVSRGAAAQGTNFRHGDILNAVYFLHHAHSSLVRQIYFGNWLRDFSQLLDRKTLEVIPEPILRAIVSIFAFTQFGYSTGEFEVTSERLGSYRPEEHIDNPKGYDGGIYTQLRAETHPEELRIQSKQGMKSYIANPTPIDGTTTSLEYIERQLIAAIACGRARDPEAYTHLGAALHTLEDFVAHSNYLELCMQMLSLDRTKDENVAAGLANVFAFVGDATRVTTSRGSAPPLVTGTFGTLDLYQSLLGEVDDKIAAINLPGLQKRMKDPRESISGVSKVLVGLLAKFEGANFDSDITKITKSAMDEPADWGKLNETPELLWQQLEPVFRLRDKIVRWVYDHMTINAVANAIAAISTAIDKLVYLVIGIFLGPVLRDVSSALQYQADQLYLRDQQVRLTKGEQSIFENNSTATDPTHSQLCKDHYNHELNELAGRVATKITTFTIKKVIEIWQPGMTTDVRPTLKAILETLHHPFNYSLESEIQGLMVAEVLDYCTTKERENPAAFATTLQHLNKQYRASKVGEEDHSHEPRAPTVTAAYTGANQQSRNTAHNLTTINEPRVQTAFASKLSKNIESSLKKGSFAGLTLEDLPLIKEIMSSTPSADTPNPIDSSLLRFPGTNLLTLFDGIDIGEIIAAPGMGVVLKDALIRMRLADTEWVDREQIAAKERLGALEDRPVKEMLMLLDVKPIYRDEMDKTPPEESKMRRLMDKMKIGGKS